MFLEKNDLNFLLQNLTKRL
jgi:hypothetical protein